MSSPDEQRQRLAKKQEVGVAVASPSSPVEYGADATAEVTRLLGHHGVDGAGYDSGRGG